MTLFIGVDGGRDRLVVASFREGQDASPQCLGSFPNRPEQFDTLLRRVQQQARGEDIVWVIEPCGGYERPLMYWLYEHGQCILYPNPRQVRRWQQGRGHRAKTDSLDSQMLAQYGAEHRQNLHPWTPWPEPAYRLLRLAERLQELEAERRREQNRLEAYRSQGISSDVPEIRDLEEHIQFLDGLIRRTKRHIGRLYQDFPHLDGLRRRLLSVPGVGVKTVHLLVALLVRWAQLGRRDAKGLVAYLGLDPRIHQSGTRPPRGHISKQGDVRWRSLLVAAARGGLQGAEGPLARFYRRLRERGKSHMVALVAAARKIVVWAWAVYCSGEPFDLRRHIARA
ncbi:MAG: IS110 family transposase [Anaerolineae bacterium]|nr:IS110 family transposase [Anaerolineae bacterium]